MRSRPLLWLLLSVMLFVAAAYLCRLGGQWATGRILVPAARSHSPSPVSHASPITPLSPIPLLSQPQALNSPPPEQSLTQHATRNTNPFTLRLTNSATPLRQLIRRPSAILLENALLDTSKPLALAIPDHLRAQDDPGAYVVQSRAPLDDAFRARMQAAGAVIVAYIPNQACLVSASPTGAQQLAADPLTQAVLPYEPYFKLKPPLLALAVEQQPLPDNQTLNVLLFPGARTATLDQVKDLGVEILGEERSPFGPVVSVRVGGTGGPSGGVSATTPAALLPALARLAGVEEVELARARVLANDLSRARIGVANNTTTPENYLGLRGSNVLVSVSDSGVDTNQPDLQGRVLFDLPPSGVDTNGHGTHVAGIIAGSGLESTNLTSASGSSMPAISYQFRGMAPAAQVLAIAASPDPGPASDTYLQETAARRRGLHLQQQLALRQRHRLRPRRRPLRCRRPRRST